MRLTTIFVDNWKTIIYIYSLFINTFTCRWCLGVMKCFCASCALLCREGCSYPTSRCRYVDVFIDGCIPPPTVSALDKYCIPRVLSLVATEKLILWRFSDKNMGVIILICGKGWQVVRKRVTGCQGGRIGLYYVNILVFIHKLLTVKNLISI